MSRVGAKLTEQDKQQIYEMHCERMEMLEQARTLERRAREIRDRALPLTGKNLAAKFEVSPKTINQILWG